MDKKTTLEIKDVSKIFPGVRALDHVNIRAEGGEVVGLIGVNGAGKSTLMNILGGVHTQTEGQIIVDGKEVNIQGPEDAERLGIGFIHQEPVMFSHMTVAENICLSRMHGRIDYSKMKAEARKYLDIMNCDIDPGKKVGELPIGERQMVEIARALSAGGKILLFDEPTASFSDKEREKLFEVIRGLREKGSCIFFISHFLDEVAELTDRTIVLRDGRVVVEGKTAEISRQKILDNMVGGKIARIERDEKTTHDKVIMKVENLTVGNKPDHISFEIHKGEVVGLWGLMGSGRTETCRAIYGLDKADEGAVYLDREDGSGLQKLNAAEQRELLGYVSEARHDDGCLLPWSIWENIAAPNLPKYKKGWFLDYNRQKEDGKKYCELLNVKTPSVNTKIEALSGGNQQKVIMAKWMVREPKVFLIDEPTRGVDVGAKAEIQKMIRQLAKNGTACIVVSSEIEEISALCDRVLVLNRGKIAGEVNRYEISKEALMEGCV